MTPHLPRWFPWSRWSPVVPGTTRRALRHHPWTCRWLAATTLASCSVWLLEVLR